MTDSSLSEIPHDGRCIGIFFSFDPGQCPNAAEQPQKCCLNELYGDARATAWKGLTTAWKGLASGRHMSEEYIGGPMNRYRRAGVALSRHWPDKSPSVDLSASSGSMPA
jgi:hypothetical protein